MLKRLALLGAILVAPAFLSACDTADERAQKHYEKGMALLESGDTDRALVEFRNVFQLNGEHKEARLAYARVQEDRGDVREAYGQYLRLVEQYPDNLEGRRALAQIAANLNNWDEVARHIEVAEKLAPQDAVVLSVRAGLDYRNALKDENAETAKLAVKVSQDLLEENPDLEAARRVVIDDLLKRQEWEAALAAIDEGMKSSDDQSLYVLRLGVLERLGRGDDVIDQLNEMVDKFPGSGIHRTLVNRYIATGRLDDAETYLKERIEKGAMDGPEAHLELVAFLASRRGRDEAIAQLDELLSGETEHRELLRAVRAGLEFDKGNREEAILEVQDILDGREPSEELDRIKIVLANMLIQNGNSVGARALVEEVLEHDRGQVDAVKLKAGWLIEDDLPGDALVDLRTALDQAPRDAEILTLMAQAHERSGNRELMGETLALAVEAAENAPEESLRYVQYLIQEEKFLPAEDVLQDALRLQRGNLQLLGALGGLYVRMEDWPRTQHVIDALRQDGSDKAGLIADELTARKLAGQNQEQELEQFLTGLASESSGLQAAASVIRLKLAQGDTQGAKDYVAELQEKNPDNPVMQFLRASVLIATGERAQATEILTELAEAYPINERIWLSLYRLHRSQGDNDLAEKTLNEALVAMPGSSNLKWAAAGEAETKGDIDKAIAIYEDLYSTNSSSMIIANNLASLISSYREDDESLQRAYNIARRLRGTDVAAFQDTYGWISFRMGNNEEAVGYLEAAVKGLPEDPTVQFHLAEIYAAMGQTADALTHYEKAVDLLQESGSQALPWKSKADEQIKTLSAQEN